MKKPFSLLYKAAFAVTVITLPILVTFVHGYLENKSHIEKHSLDDLTVIAEAYEGQVYQFLEMSKRRAQDFSTDGVINGELKKFLGGHKQAQEVIASHLQKNKLPVDKSINRISVIGTNGVIMASTERAFMGRSVAQESFFTEGLERTFVVERARGPEGTRELAVSSPVYDENGSRMGVIAIFLHLSDLNRVLTGEFNRDLGALTWKKGKRKTMEAYLVNRNKVLLTDSIFIKDAAFRQKVDTLPVRECLESQREITDFYEDYRGVRVAGASMCLPSMGWVLLAEVDSDEMLAPIEEIYKDAIVGGAVSVSLIFGLFIIFYKGVIVRLGEISHASGSIADGDYDITIPIRSNDEIGTLSESFNRMARDIKRRDMLLRESEERLKAIIDNSPAVIFMKDLEGRYILINRRFEELFGISNIEMKGRSDLDMFPEDIARNLRENDRKVIEARSPVGFDESVPGSDRMHHYISIKFPLFDHSGAPFAVCGIATDITDRKRMEDALKESEERYRSLVSNIPDATWTSTEEGRTVFISENIKDLTGYTPDDFQSKSDLWTGNIHPSDAQRITGSHKALFREGKKYEEEYRFRRKDGRWVWLYDRATSAYLRDGIKLADGIVSDVTERKLSEEKLERLNRLYSVLSAINEAIIRERDPDKLYAESCRILVERGKFLFAWVGKVDWPSMRVVPDASYGPHEDYIDGIDISLREIPAGLGPTGIAVRGGKYIICNDIESDACMAPWRENALKRNFRSSACFPIMPGGIVSGALNIYSGEPDFFTDDEIRLLEALSADIAFAVETMEVEKMGQRADEELKLLQAISLAIREAIDYYEALRVVITKICETTRWSFGEVWLPKADKSALEYGSIWYGKGAELERFAALSGEVSFKFGYGLPGRVWESKSPEWVRDISIDGVVFKRSAVAKEAGLKAAFAVPIISGEDVLAVIVFFMSEEREEDKRLVDLVSAVSAQLGTVFRRKLAEDARLELKERYEGLVKNLATGIFRTTAGDMDVFIEANPALIEMLEAGTREELFTHKVSEFFADARKSYEINERIVSTGSVKDEEVEFVTLGGRRFWGSLTAVLVRDKEGAYYFDGTLEDVTERKKLEDQLRQAQKMEAVGQLAGGIAHDFNNILTALIGYGNLLLMKKGGDDTVKGYSENILTLCDKAARLTQGLLAFSRKQVMRPEPVDLNELVKRVEKILTRLIGEDIELKSVLSDAPLMVTADSTLIEQVLMNLSTNARDAMPRGGKLTIGTKPAELGAEYIETHGYGAEGRYALIEFKDTGAGMDEATRKKIFEPFFTTKEVGKGTGLGLSIVYGIVKQHNGFIDVRSSPGAGTTFSIYLPLTVLKPGRPRPVIHAEFRGGRETVLLAEDEPDVRAITKSMLEEFGYEVMTASNGEEAVERFREKVGSIDLLIFDLVMPKKNGREAYEDIRKIRSDIKVLFTSGYTADTMKVRGEIDEGLSFISKPVSPAELLKKVREVLDR